MKSMMIKYDNASEISPGGFEKKGYYPSMEIPGKTIPELMDKAIDDECEIRFKVKITSLRKDDRGEFAGVEIIEGEYVE